MLAWRMDSSKNPDAEFASGAGVMRLFSSSFVLFKDLSSPHLVSQVADVVTSNIRRVILSFR